MIGERFWYAVRYVTNYDGDTIDFEVDLGFKIEHELRVRLNRLDTPELRGADKARGITVRDIVHDLLANAVDIRIQTFRDRKGKFGRYVAEVWFEQLNTGWTNLNEWLIDSGHALEKPDWDERP